MDESQKLPQYVACLTVTIGAFALGTVFSWTSPALPLLDPTKNNKTDINIPVNESEGSWVASIMCLGALVMMIPMGMAVDKFGLKWPTIFVVIPFVVGWVLIAFAANLPMYLVDRFLTGMAGGAFTISVPVYIGEVAEKDIRGTLGSFFQLMDGLGILFVYIVGTYTSVMVLSIICGVIPIIFGVLFAFMPESPQTFLKQNKRGHAHASLQWLRGKNCNVVAELNEMEAIVREAAQNKSSFKDCFTSHAARRAIVISFGLMIFQQLSGINAVIFFTVDIFHNAGSILDDNVCTMIVGAVQVVFNLTSAIIVDKLGRRVLLLFSDFMMTICQLVLGIYFYLKDDTKDDVGSIEWLPLVSVIVFIIAFSLGYGPIPYLMIGELFASEMTGVAVSLSCLLHWIMSFIVTKFFIDLKIAFGSAVTFWIFAVICCTGTVFVFFAVFETKGKSLDEIQRILDGKVHTEKDQV